MGTDRIPRRAGHVRTLDRIPCRWCGRMPENGRRTFCSEVCVHEHKLRTQPEYAARCVLKRDHGVCSACGRDCLRLMADLQKAALEAARERANESHVCRESWWNPRAWRSCGHPECVEMEAQNVLRALGPERLIPDLLDQHGIRKKWRTLRYRLWEMDHILPVVEGGGDCGLDNLRTLCRWCHQKATNELAGRRKARRA
jgi:5-methylcytosine-specific restriction enzyme A